MKLKQAIKQLLWITALAVLAAGITFFVHKKAPALYEVSVVNENEVTWEEVHQWAGKVIWIDARSERDFAKSHVGGALLLNQENWADLLWQHRDVIESVEEADRLVVYCDGSNCRRSSEIAERLRTELALERVYVLKGEWK
ncbi:MAG: rhodanese-like domain-containing protein [Verrucomicrobiales bacterium]|nr:rhodanese-like domain-containing protein [Verrucomicrobiales bacterium]